MASVQKLSRWYYLKGKPYSIDGGWVHNYGVAREDANCGQHIFQMNSKINLTGDIGLGGERSKLSNSPFFEASDT